jgi:hypothetical protein
MKVKNNGPKLDSCGSPEVTLYGKDLLLELVLVRISTKVTN